MVASVRAHLLYCGVMRRTRVPAGNPTISVGLRAPLPLSRALDDVARLLNVTKNNLVVTILEHELSQADGKPPAWWDEWVGQRSEQDLLIGENEVT